MHVFVQMDVRTLHCCGRSRKKLIVPRASRFNASRYPTKPSDTAAKFDPAANNHVVFVRKNKFYEVSLVDASGQELSGHELER